MQVDGILVKGEYNVYQIGVSGNLILGRPDDDELVSTADQGRIIMLQVNSIAQPAEKPADQYSGAIDTIAGLTPSEYRNLWQSKPPSFIIDIESWSLACSRSL